ncbi:hypothetical protein OJ996_06385 [Luteolibacter sp. GHJ8]|uniref:Integral membrane protein n=1 Tax=Luteolibacter rhizosphaerae TaxID=2989719 RepID=A0ABT3G1R4_9BACT|nr:hypothetical protein [Luteolibacter rhizosphaerae]MCW1913190.1 hypothetical protein [Luteolibacter rhizosphaerae]
MPARVLMLFVFCGAGFLRAEEAAPLFKRASPEGHLQSRDLNEASGMAASPSDNRLLWLLNDSGCSAELFLTETDGGKRGRVSVEGVKNVDWEDLASFELGGKPFLIISDTGDNASKRKSCMLYVVPEPRLPAEGVDLEGAVKPAWTIRFRYEDGPRDCESLAVDVKAGKILLLSKRTNPPMLYELPLKPEGKAEQVARKIGQLSKTLPMGFPPIPYGTQPTGMDISADGTMATVVTYAGVFVFPRGEGETWAQAFAREPQELDSHQSRQAEAIAFSRDGKTIWVTAEGVKAPVIPYRRVEEKP